MSDFVMPSLGPDMEAGTLVEWLTKTGQQVKRGDVVAVVETEKGAIEIEIFESGIISEIVVPVGTKVPVGTLLARLGGPADRAGAAAPISALAAVLELPAAVPQMPPLAAQPVASPAVPPVTPKIAASPAGEARPRITPAARQRAAELGVPLGGIKGSGIEGAIALADIEAAAAQPPAQQVTPSPRTRRSGFDTVAMRNAIAAAMTRSKREIPHYYLGTTVNLGPALAWLESTNRERPPATRLLPAALFLKATAKALRKTPELNGFWESGAFRAGAGLHIGWAIALRGGGLVAPGILDAGERTLDDLMAALRDLIQRARNGGLRSSELNLPTITVTSLGERGAELVFPIINLPQVASVGFGRVIARPWVVEDALAIRPVVTVSLAGDHRNSDGHRGGLLLNEIERLLQQPEAL
jgi:pyruvate dehydrogenase E2 component (dihydrolipoamide acetyltransferase)